MVRNGAELTMLTWTTMNILLSAVGVFAFAFVVLLTVIATRSGQFSVARSVTIDATPEQIFPMLNSLRNFQSWSPFAAYDPNSKIVYEGPECGPGACQKWSGNKRVGEGSMTITSSVPQELVVSNLVFTRPFRCNNTVHFEVAPVGNQTRVSWKMFGTNGFMGKAMSLLMNMDAMVGKDFSRGLAQLKSKVESEAPAVNSLRG